MEKSDTSLKPGEVSIKQGYLLIGTKDSTIRLSKIQLEGKKACSDIELINGLKGDIQINP